MKKDFLKLIVEHKKQEVAEAEKKLPENELRAKAETPAARRPFIKKLQEPGPAGVNIIAEVKRASPSKGSICPELDPAVLAGEYEAGGAAAVSVLTEQKYFKGSIDDLKKARQATSLPVLRKDFLITPYQVYESAVIGADAILLIVRILSKTQLKDLLGLSKELGLDALVEINSEDEVEAASESGARLIGINNRNLKSFETDIKTAMRLKSLLAPDQIAVAASGISARNDIEKNLEFGIHNFLIGESLVRAEDTKAFLRSLIEPGD